MSRFSYLLSAFLFVALSAHAATTITHVQDIGTSTSTTTGLTSISVPVTTATTAGNFISVSVCSSNADSASTVTDSAGNSYGSSFSATGAAAGSSTFHAVFLFSSVTTTAIPNSGTITVHFQPLRAGDIVAVTASEFSGVISSTPDVKATNGSAGSNTATTVGPITTNQVNELVIGVFGSFNSTGAAAPAFTTGAGFTGMPGATQATGTRSGGVFPEYQIVSAKAAYTATGTFGSTSQYDAVIVSYRGTPAPTVTAVSPNTGLPTGGTSVTLTGTSFTGATAVQFGGVNATNFTVNSATSISCTSPAGTGVVDISVSNVIGTSPTVVADRFSYINPMAITTQPASVNIFSAHTTTLTVAATGADLQYQWYQGNSGDVTAPIAGATATSYTTSALTVTTNFWVKVSNTGGSLNSNTATVTVVSTPIVNGSSSSSALLNAALQFSVGTPSSDATVTWNFGDGATGGGPSVTHSYSASGTYQVVATLTDAGGQTSTESLSVTVGPISFRVNKCKFKLNSDSDSASITGIIHVPAGLTLSSTPFTINVGGNTQTFTFANGRRATNGGNSFTLAARTKNGVTISQEAKFTLTLAGDLSTAIKANSPLDANGYATQISVLIQFAGLSDGRTLQTAFKSNREGIIATSSRP